MKYWISLAFALCSLPSFAAKVAIVIDDIGYHKLDYKLLELPYELTFAVIPHTTHSNAVAKAAYQQRRDVILHMPMESARRADLSKNALKVTMSRSQIERKLQAAFADVPYAIGINNHMGGYFTEQANVMDWTLAYVAKRQLFFLDSKTTARSQAGVYAKKHQIPLLTRHVFLDNDRSYKALDKQFNLMIKLAKQQQQAIAIGHPYPETYAYLKKHLPDLAARGIEVVKLSSLLPSDYAIITAAQTADVPLSLPEQDPIQPKPVAKPEKKSMNMTTAAVFTPAIDDPAAIISMYQRQWDIPALLNPMTLPRIKPTQPLMQKPWELPEPVKKPTRSLPFYQLGGSL
ncbi:MAG: divergent polysaccharide deacetylase family protein [Gammaproteobacteria bacterium]|nr:divergent polysaccharide deacetylase family protein [Gammaproteobacteria bacterium]MBU2057454.1 divergent polysaccharide deacetylase family protein [Gammaproteobacteria bacterium]MBU2176818.1 divergent polysaccharide deacetylase family protein [Gammaproteobacteria bacterium]MBU2247930.1 divergent polysaccharide deacetylase family protein [Gammaproteobacteria bacterium]MBU2342856.1 divergent polysaccharide deacetylase family protein [Gammaproteobacteria bacterium]